MGVIFECKKRFTINFYENFDFITNVISEYIKIGIVNKCLTEIKIEILLSLLFPYSRQPSSVSSPLAQTITKWPI